MDGPGTFPPICTPRANRSRFLAPSYGKRRPSNAYDAHGLGRRSAWWLGDGGRGKRMHGKSESGFRDMMSPEPRGGGGAEYLSAERVLSTGLRVTARDWHAMCNAVCCERPQRRSTTIAIRSPTHTKGQAVSTPIPRFAKVVGSWSGSAGYGVQPGIHSKPVRRVVRVAGIPRRAREFEHAPWACHTADALAPARISVPAAGGEYTLLDRPRQEGLESGSHRIRHRVCRPDQHRR